MKQKLLLAACLGLFVGQLQAGVIDPDCDAGKAAKSAAMKSTVGVGGRCSPKEALTDSAGIDDKKDKISDSKDSIKDGKDTTNKMIKKDSN